MSNWWDDIFNGQTLLGNLASAGSGAFFENVGTSLGAPSTETKNAALGQQQGNLTTQQNLWNQMIANSNQYYQQTQPMRDLMLKRVTDILSGNYNPASSPAYAPMKRATEQTYGTARGDIMSSLPGGGTQQRALGNLAVAKGGKLTDIMSQILSGELTNAYKVSEQSFPEAMKALLESSQAGATAGGIGSSILDYLTKQLTGILSGVGGGASGAGSLMGGMSTLFA